MQLLANGRILLQNNCINLFMFPFVLLLLFIYCVKSYLQFCSLRLNYIQHTTYNMEIGALTIIKFYYYLVTVILSLFSSKRVGWRNSGWTHFWKSSIKILETIVENVTKSKGNMYRLSFVFVFISKEWHWVALKI